HDKRRQGEDHAGGEIDLSADHQHDLATGNDGGWRNELRQVLQAGAAQQKVMIRVFKIRDQDQCDDQDAGLPPAQERVQEARAAWGCRSVHRASAHALIGPERGTICGLSDLPSYRVEVARYGSTLSLVTNFRPVLVSAGPANP